MHIIVFLTWIVLFSIIDNANADNKLKPPKYDPAGVIKWREMQIKLMTCCVMGFAFSDPFAKINAHAQTRNPFRPKPSSLKKDGVVRVDNPRITILRTRPIHADCKSMSTGLNSRVPQDKFSERYLARVITRICDSVEDRGGVFSSHHLGPLPFEEIQPGGKYRFTFYTDVVGFPIALSSEMGAPKNTYLEVTVTYNVLENESSGGAASFRVSFDCDGSWRNFFDEPDSFRTLFSAGTRRFSLEQQDSCEAILLNALKLSPKMFEKLN